MSTATLIPVEEYLSTSYRPDRDYIDGEVRERNVIAVEDRDDVGSPGTGRVVRREEVERVVEIAGLGVVVHRPAHITRAKRLTHLRNPRPVTVVEHPRLVRRRERARSSHGGCDDFDRLVVGRDQDRDAHAVRRLLHRCGENLSRTRG